MPPNRPVPLRLPLMVDRVSPNGKREGPPTGTVCGPSDAVQMDRPGLFEKEGLFGDFAREFGPVQALQIIR